MEKRDANEGSFASLGKVLVGLIAPLILPGCAVIFEKDPAVAPPESAFERVEIPVEGTNRSYPGWRTRSPGPPVLLLHAINGVSPELLLFALELERWGYRVYTPSLYGDPIWRYEAYGYDKELLSWLVVQASSRWTPSATDSAGPIVEDVAAMARWISEREAGRDVAVIGNSFTGAFPLALLREPAVRIAVVGQPTLPAKRMPGILLRIPQPERYRRSLSLTAEGWDEVVAALREDPKKRILGFHYEEDPIGAIDRFDELRERLVEVGLEERFQAWVLTPPESAYRVGRAEWVSAGKTSEARTMLTPHSTFMDAENAEDRAWFRAQLRLALEHAW